MKPLEPQEATTTKGLTTEKRITHFLESSNTKHAQAAGAQITTLFARQPGNNNKRAYNRKEANTLSGFELY